MNQIRIGEKIKENNKKRHSSLMSGMVFELDSDYILRCLGKKFLLNNLAASKHRLGRAVGRTCERTLRTHGL